MNVESVAHGDVIDHGVMDIITNDIVLLWAKHRVRQLGYTSFWPNVYFRPPNLQTYVLKSTVGDLT